MTAVSPKGLLSDLPNGRREGSREGEGKRRKGGGGGKGEGRRYSGKASRHACHSYMTSRSVLSHYEISVLWKMSFLTILTG